MATELDPMFQKVLVLLHSKSKDSAEQMKLLVEEFLKLKTGKDIRIKLPVNPPARLVSKSGAAATPIVEQESKRKAEKTEDLFDMPLSMRDAKRARTDVESPTKRGPVAEDADDLVSEIMDFACLVCKGLDLSSGNQLVECRECNALYHQECHKPPISEQDVLAFTCSSCLRSPKKSSHKIPSSSGSSNSSKVSKSDGLPKVSASSSLSSKDSSYKKEKEKSSSSKSSSSSRSGPYSPSSKSGSSSSKSSSSNSSSKSSASSISATGSSFLQDADKRLQLLKKKAATKFNEKRKGK